MKDLIKNFLSLFTTKEDDEEKVTHKPKEIKIAKKKLKNKKTKPRRQGNMT
jgi:hypothetical protein|tara:strand:+ start:1001 stop:1153 length:153 start_codon:yes stop_codon:yes gene_type:complete